LDSDLDLNAVDSDLKAVDLDLDFLVSARLGLEGSGLGYWWTCYKSGKSD